MPQPHLKGWWIVSLQTFPTPDVWSTWTICWSMPETFTRLSTTYGRSWQPSVVPGCGWIWPSVTCSPTRHSSWATWLARAGWPPTKQRWLRWRTGPHQPTSLSCGASCVWRNDCVTRWELLAVLLLVRHFRPYLLGARFTLRTDHASLTWMLNFRQPESQVARWVEILQGYEFKVQHRPGWQHANADALSRRPCLTDECRYCGCQE